jgi:hypothetical protein
MLVKMSELYAGVVFDEDEAFHRVILAGK